jgi:hypothetical protein
MGGNRLQFFIYKFPRHQLEDSGEIRLTLNSDELGLKGQSRFAEICNDAKLVRNSSSHQDRTGWDYIVEFSQEPPTGDATLDTRGSPLSCHVQVKTMRESNDTFKMRLSAAERLAKEPKPAFVYVFKVSKDLNFVSAHLVHVLDENLAKVLKRLRFEEAKGTSPSRINRKYISFQVSRCAHEIAPTGKAFRRAVLELCGSDLNSYIEKKRTQFANLGFEADRYQATTTFKVESMDGFVDGLLGLGELRVSNGQVFETRFGFKLPRKESNLVNSTMRIQPGKADSCIITVRETPLAAPAVFSADIFLPPVRDLPKAYVKYLVKAPLFHLLIQSNELHFSTNEEAITTASLQINDWLNLFRMLVALCRGAEMTIKPERLAEGFFQLKMPDAAREHEYEDLLLALEAAQRLLKLAGAPEPAVSLEGIAAIGPALVELDGLFSGTSRLGFSATWPPEVPVPDKLDFLHVNYIQMPGITLVHSSLAQMVPQTKEGRIEWKSNAVTPCEITFVRNFPAEYERFIDRAKGMRKADASMIAEPRTRACLQLRMIIAEAS